MAVNRHKPVGVLDVDHAAIPAAVPGVYHHTVSGNVDLGAFGYGNIEPGMVFLTRADRREGAIDGRYRPGRKGGRGWRDCR